MHSELHNYAILPGKAARCSRGVDFFEKVNAKFSKVATKFSKVKPA